MLSAISFEALSRSVYIKPFLFLCLAAPPPSSTPMGMVWEVMETEWGFRCLMLGRLCQCYGYLRNADSPVLADHGAVQEMTITTKAKFDSKCHSVPPSSCKVATTDHVGLVSLHREGSLTCHVVSKRSASA